MTNDQRLKKACGYASALLGTLNRKFTRTIDVQHALGDRGMAQLMALLGVLCAEQSSDCQAVEAQQITLGIGGTNEQANR